MLFNESNDLCEENLKIKRDLEVPLGKVGACAAALLYLEYYLKSKYKGEELEAKIREAVFYLFVAVEHREHFKDVFTGLEEFCFRVLKECEYRGWSSFFCMIDDMELDSGFTGNMGRVRLVEIVKIFKCVLEYYHELPITQILKVVKD